MTCHEGTDVAVGYSSTLSLISELHEGGWFTPRPGHFHPPPSPGMTQYPLYRRLWWTPGLVWTGAETVASPPGFDPWTVQPVEMIVMMMIIIINVKLQLTLCLGTV